MKIETIKRISFEMQSQPMHTGKFVRLLDDNAFELAEALGEMTANIGGWKITQDDICKAVNLMRVFAGIEPIDITEGDDDDDDDIGFEIEDEPANDRFTFEPCV